MKMCFEIDITGLEYEFEGKRKGGNLNAGQVEMQKKKREDRKAPF